MASLAEAYAVIVGGGTVRADDPLLTSRGLRSPEPLRVVLSRRLDLPDQAQIWDQSVAPTLVVHGQDAPAEARDRLEALGLQREVLPACGPESLMAVLAQRGCNRVLWECGPELAAAALQQACVQELAAVIAPKLLGGEPARTPLGHLGFQAMEEVVVLQGLRQQRLTDDLLLQVTLSSLSDPC